MVLLCSMIQEVSKSDQIIIIYTYLVSIVNPLQLIFPKGYIQTASHSVMVSALELGLEERVFSLKCLRAHNGGINSLFFDNWVFGAGIGVNFDLSGSILGFLSLFVHFFLYLRFTYIILFEHVPN